MLKRVVQEIKDSMQEDTIFENSKEIVSYELRRTVSKLLIEVEEYEDALFVLNGLYEEDSSFLEVNYMLAFV